MSTVGVDCETILFAGGEVTIHDFAGQIEYSTSHHLFLSMEVHFFCCIYIYIFLYLLLIKLVAYLVCFDLGATMEEQSNQVSYWLNFLNSSLPLPSGTGVQCNGKWAVFLVGLRSDLQEKTELMFQTNHLQTWKMSWSRLPIFDQIFSVSSLKSSKSVRGLFNKVGLECYRIFTNNSVFVPALYRQVMNELRSIPDGQCFVSKEELKERFDKNMQISLFDSALQYLHNIGRIICFSNGLVCTNASVAPKIVAKFISPEEVRLRLLRTQTDTVQILSKEEIGYLLAIDTNSNERYDYIFISNK